MVDPVRIAGAATWVDSSHSAPWRCGELSKGGGRTLQPQRTEQPVEDAVVGVIVTAGRPFEVIADFVVLLADAVIEQQVAGRQHEIPRDVNDRKEQQPNPRGGA